MGIRGQPYAPSALPPGKNPSTHYVGGWVGRRGGLDDIETKKYVASAGIRTSVRPAPNPVTIPTTLSWFINVKNADRRSVTSVSKTWLLIR
jgi:hypothetical protein